jgi:hypothetical protein
VGTGQTLPTTTVAGADAGPKPSPFTACTVKVSEGVEVSGRVQA